MNAKLLSWFVRKPGNFIAAMLVGNCISLVIYSIYIEKKFHHFFSAYLHSELLILLLATLGSTIIILITAEYLPKNFFRINPNAVLNFFAIPLVIIYWILSPVVYFVLWLSDLFLRTFTGVQVRETETSFGRIDLDHLVRESTGRHDPKQHLEHEVAIFRKALDFSEVKARECMVPRTEIVALQADVGIEELRKKFVETRLSKILIYETNIDSVIGYVHSHELFRPHDSIRSVLLPVLIVPESMSAMDALTLFIQQRKSIAIVVDEFGVTAGCLTMEDVMEEIFGEIEDEHDKEELVEKRIAHGEFIFSGRFEIDTLNERYKFGLLKDEAYETLSGYILNHFRSIPKPGDVINTGKFQFTILAVAQGRIELINLRIVEP